MGKINRIAITGASGVGKTTLANFISEEYNIPFISASARDVWPKFGFENHAQALSACLKDPILGLRYQESIWLNRNEALNKSDRWVTDRSPIDNYAYFLLQQGYYNERQTLYMKELCLRDYLNIDLIIFIRTGKQQEVENNSRRICNLVYQRMVDQVISWVLMSEFGPTTTQEIICIDTRDWEERKSIIRVNLNE